MNSSFKYVDNDFDFVKRLLPQEYEALILTKKITLLNKKLIRQNFSWIHDVSWIDVLFQKLHDLNFLFCSYPR